MRSRGSKTIRAVHRLVKVDQNVLRRRPAPQPRMRYWPVLLDSVPEYLADGSASLLQTPMGNHLVVSHLLRLVQYISFEPVTIVAPPESGSDYKTSMRDAYPSASVATTADQLAEALAPAEASDLILIVDPRCLPTNGAHYDLLLPAGRPQAARHLVAFPPDSVGTNEHVNIDANGLVRSVQRRFDSGSSPFIAGVAASLIPATSGILSFESLPSSLLELRRQLVVRGMPSQDVSINVDAFDLTTERGFLAAAERSIVEASESRRVARAASTVLVGEGHDIHPTARLFGPVVVQSHARIGARVTIVGPALIGARSNIESDAVVAHAVVGTESFVPSGRVIRDRVWLTQTELRSERAEPTAHGEYAERFSVEPRSVESAAPVRGTRNTAYAVWKRIFDVTVAAISLIVLSPLLMLIAALVRLDSPDGPAFYADEREGLGGRLFKCLKFRTMRNGASALQRDLKRFDSMDGPHFKLKVDPRVTRLGRILRATNLDEIPQLFNVLVGDMSLVGPRPSPFRENQICVPWREGRLSLRPGLTGLWQVCRKDRASGDFHQWIEYDLLYVQHVSPWLDLKILVATIFTFGGRIPVPVSWMVRTANREPPPPPTVPSPASADSLRRSPAKGVRAFSGIGSQNRPVRPT
jgi:lipopolysaccharide/colanic/teichoic acid biosynthesis glycosyltransferase